MKTSIHRILAVCILMLSGGMGLQAGSKPLSEKDRTKLADVARHQYTLTDMEGATMYKFKGRNVLVVITEVKKNSNAQRVGQVKASRLAGEFLQKATNKSVTVYSVADGSSYSLEDEGSERSSMTGSGVSGRVSQTTEDYTTTATQESFSDRIIQSSITRVGHIEPLCKIGTEGNNIIFAYFMIIEK